GCGDRSEIGVRRDDETGRRTHRLTVVGTYREFVAGQAVGAAVGPENLAQDAQLERGHAVAGDDGYPGQHVSHVTRSMAGSPWCKAMLPLSTVVSATEAGH